MKPLFLIATAAALGAFAPQKTWAQSTPYIGQIATFAYDFCPVGWSSMAGQLLSIQQNNALFALLGTRFGGDGITTFALPTAKVTFTLTRGAPLLQCIALQGVFPAHP